MSAQSRILLLHLVDKVKHIIHHFQKVTGLHVYQIPYKKRIKPWAYIILTTRGIRDILTYAYNNSSFNNAFYHFPDKH